MRDVAPCRIHGWSTSVGPKHGEGPRTSAFAALLAVVLTLAGCTAIQRVVGFKEQAKQARAIARISGRVEAEGPSEGTLVVVLGRVVEGEATPVGVDSYVREHAGSFLFLVGPGRYVLGAYEDRNRNGLLDPDERVARVKDSPILEIAAGGVARYDLLLRDDSPMGAELPAPFDVLAIIERTPREQREFSLWAFSQQGTPCEDLSDERFGPEAGPRGLWNPMDFLNDELPGVYFLEPYDPDRVPVLFVHGIAGYPQEFSTLIDELDRTRFQPWFYFYPSGFGLDGISGHLSTLLQRLQIQYGFDELAIVAHSMGGLVSRGAILKYASESHRHDVRLFVSISTPWGGDVGAQRTENAPIELPASFQDMNPGSDYLRWLFYEDADRQHPKLLPRRVAYHMIFGFGGSGGACNDGRVSCASEARYDNQEQARSVLALDYGHAEILHSPETVARVNRLLAERF